MLKKVVLTAVVACGAGLLMPSARAQSVTVGPAHRAGYWVLATRQFDADVPNTGRNLQKPTCVAVAYTIGSDGKTRDLRVRKMVPKGDLYKAALSVIQHFEYTPSSGNPNQVPVRTYYIVPFNLPPGKAARQRITHACDLPGFDSGS